MAITITRRTLTSLFSRIASRFPLPLIEHHQFTQSQLTSHSVRLTSSGPGHPTLNLPPSPSPSPKRFVFEGCDYKHWFVIMGFPKDLRKPNEIEMVDCYVKTLASVLGSEEEAKKKIYSVSTATYTGFGALISEEIANKLKDRRYVLWVLPDSYFDIANKDYGGDLFDNGKVTPRPQYRCSVKPQETSRPN